MRRSNYDLSTALVAIGAVVVLISLFLDWYQPGYSAFDAFEIVDWLLVALAVGALVVIGTEAWSGGGTPNNRLAWICGALAFVVVAQLLDPPPSMRGESREIGAWLALGGAVLMVAGAVMAMAQISVTIDVSERDRRQRTAAVDARADEGDEPVVRSGLSGLWQAPAAPRTADHDESDTQASPEREAAAGDRDEPPAGTAAPAGDEDPDRTQPFKPTDRPGGDDSSAA